MLHPHLKHCDLTIAKLRALRNLLFLILLCCAIPACKGGEKGAKSSKNAKEVELILQLRNSADITAVCQAHIDVELKSIKVLSARMRTWLVTVKSTGEEMTKEIIVKLKTDMDIVNVQLNHKNVEQRDE